MLSQAEVSTFLAEGYIALRAAVPAELVQACQDIIWAELAQRGIRPDEPATWAEPVVLISLAAAGDADAGSGGAEATGDTPGF